MDWECVLVSEDYASSNQVLFHLFCVAGWCTDFLVKNWIDLSSAVLWPDEAQVWEVLRHFKNASSITTFWVFHSMLSKNIGKWFLSLLWLRLLISQLFLLIKSSIRIIFVRVIKLLHGKRWNTCNQISSKLQVLVLNVFYLCFDNDVQVLFVGSTQLLWAWWRSDTRVFHDWFILNWIENWWQLKHLDCSIICCYCEKLAIQWKVYLSWQLVISLPIVLLETILILSIWH